MIWEGVPHTLHFNNRLRYASTTICIGGYQTFNVGSPILKIWRALIAMNFLHNYVMLFEA